MPNLQGEYIDPLIYDAEYGHYQGDFDFYLNLIDQGKVLDLACGTGRLTIPLARKGFETVGLDESEAMLERARYKSIGLNIIWKQGDIRDFVLEQTFDLIIMGGNSFQALLSHEDQYRMLNCVKKHLSPSGIFAFDTRNPNQNELRTTSDFEYWHSFEDSSGMSVQVSGKQNYDKESSLVTYTTKRIWFNHETRSEIQLRYTTFEELQSLLHKCGFHVMSIYGDYMRNEYTDKSQAIIIICSRDL